GDHLTLLSFFRRDIQVQKLGVAWNVASRESYARGQLCGKPWARYGSKVGLPIGRKEGKSYGTVCAVSHHDFRGDHD
ncbi:hypothetical protein, partial [Asticcacaulis benevestitus]|uniref:hypothetical protein n=1 Tax=Asticcacaulis benevestitus TaxID=347481 RepID=UPI001F1712BE